MVVSAMEPKLFINMLHVTLTGGPAKGGKKKISVSSRIDAYWVTVKRIDVVNYYETIFVDLRGNTVTFKTHLIQIWMISDM